MQSTCRYRRNISLCSVFPLILLSRWLSFNMQWCNRTNIFYLAPPFSSTPTNSATVCETCKPASCAAFRQEVLAFCEHITIIFPHVGSVNGKDWSPVYLSNGFSNSDEYCRDPESSQLLTSTSWAEPLTFWLVNCSETTILHTPTKVAKCPLRTKISSSESTECDNNYTQKKSQD